MITDPKTMFTIDHYSKIPFYDLIADNFRGLVLAGHLKNGDPAPSEADLVRYYGVSRMTVRRAMDDLERQGWIVRRQGVGTFVKHNPITRISPVKLSFTEQMRAIGRTPSSKLVSVEVIQAQGEMASHLNLAEGDPVVKIVRIRMADGEPILLETSCLSQARFPGLENATSLEAQSLYEYLNNTYGANVVTMNQTLEPVLLNKNDAKLLEARPATPAIYAEVIAYGKDGQPIEYAWSVTGSEKCKFYFTFRRGENP